MTDSAEKKTTIEIGEGSKGTFTIPLKALQNHGNEAILPYYEKVQERATELGFSKIELTKVGVTQDFGAIIGWELSNE